MLTVNWLTLLLTAMLVILLVLVFIQIKQWRRRVAELRAEIGVDKEQLDQEETVSSRDEAVWRRSYSR